MSDSFLYISEGGWAVSKVDYAGTFDEIEQFVKNKRANKLKIYNTHKLHGFPCVTFITKLDMSFVLDQEVPAIGKAIRAMILLESVLICFFDYGHSRKPITDAIATHPSLKKIKIFGVCDGISDIARRNPRIISYTLGMYTIVDYGYGDILASATGIIRLRSEHNKLIFQDGDFIRFVRNNPGIRNLEIVVSRVSEVIVALRYFDAVDELYIRYKIRDNVDGLKSATIGLLARCHPRCFGIHDGEKWHDRSAIWPNYYSIRHKDLPKWNHERSGSVCDVMVHASND